MQLRSKIEELRVTAKEHTRLVGYHRRAAKRIYRQIDELTAKLAAMGIKVTYEDSESQSQRK